MNDMLKGLDTLIYGLLIFFPLGMWKAVEIIIWVINHVRIWVQ